MSRYALPVVFNSVDSLPENMFSGTKKKNTWPNGNDTYTSHEY